MAAETLHCTGKRHGDDGSLQVAGPLMKKRTTGSVSSEFSNGVCLSFLNDPNTL